MSTPGPKPPRREKRRHRKAGEAIEEAVGDGAFGGFAHPRTEAYVRSSLRRSSTRSSGKAVRERRRRGEPADGALLKMKRTQLGRSGPGDPVGDMGRERGDRVRAPAEGDSGPICAPVSSYFDLIGQT